MEEPSEPGAFPRAQRRACASSYHLDRICREGRASPGRCAALGGRVSAGSRRGVACLMCLAASGGDAGHGQMVVLVASEGGCALPGLVSGCAYLLWLPRERPGLFRTAGPATFPQQCAVSGRADRCGRDALHPEVREARGVRARFERAQTWRWRSVRTSVRAEAPSCTRR